MQNSQPLAGVLPEVCNVPYRRNPNFTGRTTYLQQLHEYLSSGEPTALTQAISGLGGIGKTQLALEYAYRHAADYELVWWVQSEETTTLAADYASLAVRLDLVSPDQEQDAQIQRTRQWLEQHRNWLLIFDNVRQPQDVYQPSEKRVYLPRSTAGHVLITSRHNNWGEIAKPLTMQVFDRAESVVFLRERTGQSDEAAADALAEALGDLPLALAQAGAYCKSTGTSLSIYLDLFARDSRELLGEQGTLDHPTAVAVTWQLSIDRLRQTDLAAVQWLQLCTYLAPDALPIDQLMSKAVPGASAETRTKWQERVRQCVPSSLAQALTERSTFNAMASSLTQYSLIDLTDDTQSIHRLVQAAVRNSLTSQEQKQWSRRAVELVRTFFNVTLVAQQSNFGPTAFLSHAITAIEHCSSLGTAKHDELLFLALRRDMDRRFQEAIELAEIVRADPTATPAIRAQARTKLAAFYDHAKNPSKALEVLDELLRQIEEGQVGRKEGDYWWVLYQRGINLRQLGNLSAAWKVQQHILEVSPTSGMRTGALHHIGVIRLELGDYGEAQDAFEKCLEQRERKAGEPDYREVYEHRRLAQVHAYRGDLEAATDAFDAAEQIAQACLFDRYLEEICKDRRMLLEAPQYILDQGGAVIQKLDILERFGLAEGDLSRAFRVAYALGLDYLEELEPNTGLGTGCLVPRGDIHKNGVWHGTVAVLVFRGNKLALQKRGEQDSHGKWDVSASGHIKIGESPQRAAMRETYEETGFLLEEPRFEHLDTATQYRKVGRPDMERDGHVDEALSEYHYHTDKHNCELVWPFLVVLRDDEGPTSDSERDAQGLSWYTLDECDQLARQEPDQFASSYWHLVAEGTRLRGIIAHHLTHRERPLASQE